MKKAIAVGLLVIVLLFFGSYYMFPEAMFKLAINAERNAAGLTKKGIQVDDHKIVYLEGGKGEAVLLLHGFAADKDNWTRFAKYLTKDYHVVIPDLPGFGESSQILQDNYSADNQLKRIDRFTDELKLGKFNVAGSSMGGMFTAMYGAKYPQKVLTLALMAPGGAKSPNKSEMEKEVTKGANPLLVSNREDFDKLMALIFVKPPFMPAEFVKILAANAIAHRSCNEKIWNDMKWDLTQEGTPEMKSFLEPYLGQIQVPVLIIWGDGDKILDVGGVAVLEKNLKNHHTVIMKDTGHLPMLEKPKETAEAYLSFLKGKH